MDIEVIREYCLSLPGVVEDFPFDESTLVFRVAHKIFACIDLEHPQWFTLKCDHCLALELRERHSEIDGAWHWNKKYWNQVDLYGCLKDEFVKSLIRHSYSEVVKKLPKSVRMGNPELLSVKSEVF